MIEKFFGIEGPVFTVLDKVGQIIVLSVLWLLGCLPVVTICTSNCALYYAVVKAVRFGQGSAIREFWRSYRANLLRGILLSIACLAFSAGVVFLSVLTTSSFVPTGGLLVLAILAGFLFSYVGPILSRFEIPVSKVLKMAFLLSLQYAHYSLLFFFGMAALAVCQLLLFPMAMIFLVPGLWCWGISFLMEKALARYIPPKTNNDNSWYFEREEG